MADTDTVAKLLYAADPQQIGAHWDQDTVYTQNRYRLMALAVIGMGDHVVIVEVGAVTACYGPADEQKCANAAVIMRETYIGGRVTIAPLESLGEPDA